MHNSSIFMFFPNWFTRKSLERTKALVRFARPFTPDTILTGEKNVNGFPSTSVMAFFNDHSPIENVSNVGRLDTNGFPRRSRQVRVVAGCTTHFGDGWFYWLITIWSNTRSLARNQCHMILFDRGFSLHCVMCVWMIWCECTRYMLHVYMK